MVDADSDVHVIDRANAWSALRDCDFEKAGELFENIILKESDNHEAYWGRALALAGIIYVTDLNENKRVPTCNSISEESFIESSDVKKAIKLAPSEIGESYKSQAAQIEKIRVEWLEKASKEPPYDVFICFKDSDRERGLERTDDSYEAQNLYHALEKEGYKVFFSRESLRDKVSEQYEPYIYNALKTAKVMIVFGERAEYFNAVWVKNEWTRFRARIESGEKHEKALVVVYKNMSPADLPVGLRARQCLNAAEMTFLEDLKRHIRVVVDKSRGMAHLDRVEIKGGQVSKKAARIANEGVETRELGSGAIAETDVSEKQQLDLVSSYMKGNMWSDAKSLVDDILFNNPNCAEAIWYSLLIRHKLLDRSALLEKAVSFSDEDFALLEKVLNSGSREFSSAILDELYLSRAFLSEAAYQRVLKTILPYNYPNRDIRIAESFDHAVNKGHFEVFKMLISTLASDDVDKYIKYYSEFARKTKDDEKKLECAKEILKVEEGNPEALKISFETLWRDGSSSALTKTFEELLKYSKDPQSEVAWVLNKAKNTINSAEQCAFIKQALKYYGGELSDIKELLVDLAYTMIEGGYFENAKYLLELSVAAGCNEPKVYWGICLVKIGAKNDGDIAASDILIKTIPEYTKYLTLVDENRRLECFSIAVNQEKAKQKRIDNAMAKEKREREQEQEKLERIKAEKARLAAIKRKKAKKVIFGLSAVVALLLIIFVAYPMLSYATGNYAAYVNMYGVTDFEVPDGVTEIKSNAFENCSKLESVKLPDSIETIGDSAFAGCTRLRSVNIPESVKTIGYSAFSECYVLGSITIPNGVEWINSFAFNGCKALTDVVVPDSVIYMGEGVFRGCTSLKSLTLPFVGDSVSAESPSDTTLFGHIFGWSAEGVEITQFYSDGWNGDKNVCIPETLKNVTVTGGKLMFGAFSRCNMIKEITLGDNVTVVDDKAFFSCTGLESITIGKGVKSIGADAFYGCGLLRNVNISDLDAWMQVSFGNSYSNPFYVTGDMNINGEDITEIVILEGTETVEAWKYAGLTNLTSVIIPDSVTFIGEGAFSGCSGLKTVIIGANVSDIAGNAFEGCTSIEILTAPAAFLEYMPLEQVKQLTIVGNPEIENGGYISNYIIDGNTNLESLVIGKDIFEIGYRAFEGCTALKSVTFAGCSPSVGDYAFENCESLESVYIGSIDDWCNMTFSTAWSNPFYYASDLYVNGELTTEIVVPDDVSYINDYAFLGFSSITSITIPEGVLEIGYSAFDSCASLVSVVIPSSVTLIEDEAFYGCAGLKSVSIGSNDIFIGNDVFSECPSIETASVSTNVIRYIPKSNLKNVSIIGGDTIENDAFKNCVTLESVTIGNSVLNINYRVFQGCIALKSIVIPDSVVNVGDECFSGCTALESVTVGTGVVNLGRDAFSECAAIAEVHIKDLAAWCGITVWDDTANPLCAGGALYLNDEIVTSLVIPDSVTAIGYRAFANCSSITDVTVPDSVVSIGDEAFRYCANFKSFTIGKGVENGNSDSGEMSSNAFSDCPALETAYIPSWLTRRIPNTIENVVITAGNNIPQDAFIGNTSLESVVLCDTITTIDYRAFCGCTALKAIVIPDNVTSVGDDAFCGCAALETVTLGSGNIGLGTNVFDECGSLTEVHIKDIADWFGMNFSNNYSNPLYLGAGLYADGELVTDLVVPDGITLINSYAFANYRKLKSVTVPDGVTTIGTSAFWNCDDLTSIMFGYGSKLASIGNNAFYECDNLTSIMIPANVTSIGGDAFRDCRKLIEVYNLSELKIVAGELNHGYVGLCAKNVYNDNSGESRIEEKDGYVFYCDPDKAEYYLVSYNGEETELSLPESINGNGYDIYQYAFWNRDNITKVIIPDNVSVIGEYAFADCDILAEITFGSGILEIKGYAFRNSVITELELGDNLSKIGGEAFAYCYSLKSVTIPNSITSIGNNAFYDCTAVESATMPVSAIRYIYNDSLKTVVITGGEMINNAQFRAYPCLESVIICDGVTSIGDDAFDGCATLKEVYIPASVTSIGERTFRGCTSLTTVYYEGSESDWGNIVIGYENTPLKNAEKKYDQASYAGE